MTAMDRLDTLTGKPGYRLRKESLVIGMDRDNDAPDTGIGEEGLKRVTQNRLATDQAILLGSLGGLACALAPACGDDDGSDFSRRTRCHGVRLGKGLGLVHLLVHRADA